MKLTNSIIILLAAIVLCSCGSNGILVKRKHRSGFHLNFASDSKAKETIERTNPKKETKAVKSYSPKILKAEEARVSSKENQEFLRSERASKVGFLKKKKFSKMGETSNHQPARLESKVKKASKETNEKRSLGVRFIEFLIKVAIIAAALVLLYALLVAIMIPLFNTLFPAGASGWILTANQFYAFLAAIPISLLSLIIFIFTSGFRKFRKWRIFK